MTQFLSIRRFPSSLRRAATALAIFALALPLAADARPNSREPRLVNIYNFVRDNDFRLANSEAILLDATTRQIQLLDQAGLPATFALQYDALIDPAYQKLFASDAHTNFEIGAWWEIPQALVVKAGLPWRGQHEWDPAADVGFSPGYTPDERRRLVDAYMAEFKSVFGRYPRSVGSWYLDEVTLAYMAARYGVVASCNCKDQVGTDGYTLWGGYWNQAYYPSRLNAYMPAQTKDGQINVPIFRMLGSDPIYQYAPHSGMFTLEPVYGAAGGSPEWAAWFMSNLVQEPSLAFAYTQAGQENSFGWDAMKNGLTAQVALLSKLAHGGDIRLVTLAQAGEWFRRHFDVTPPTSVVYLTDWKGRGRKSVWFDSRFYRVNLLWQDGAFFIRDLHRFDQSVPSPTHDTALKTTSLAYETLPIMDSALWSRRERQAIGMRPVLLGAGGSATPLLPGGPPRVKEQGARKLTLEQPLADGGSFSLVCSENRLACAARDAQGRPLPWAWELTGGAGQKAIVQSVAADRIRYLFQNTAYDLRLAPRAGSCQQLDNGSLRLPANASGRLILVLGQEQP